jgi:undecaprenyl phosphate-alpha-L-ara4FN deformylase
MSPTLGLRIDVDTFRGTRKGVPALLKLLKKHDVKASFFFSMGPDNMGRHIRRLLNPGFLGKMLRSRGAKLYGWDILIRGTLWPGPVISKKLGVVIENAAEEGHEMGFHAWDHHRWQSKIEGFSPEQIAAEIKPGLEAFKALNSQAIASASPAWKCRNSVLKEKNKFPFRYNSDCRGTSVFLPRVGTELLKQPQIPVTLPTFDEVIGKNGMTEDTYNEHLLSLLKPDQLNVLTIHAEVEGIACLALFESFLKSVMEKGFEIVPLGSLLDRKKTYPEGRIVRQTMQGREGWLSVQAPVEKNKRGEDRTLEEA